MEDSARRYFVFDDRMNEFSIRPKNVILFGETGVGKSSVINLMAGYEIASISSNLEGCTLQATKYSFQRTDSEAPLHIYDTVGLEESDMGVNTFMGAIEKAQKLVTELHSTGGIDLLLFCVRGGRFTNTMQRNYRLFSEILCNNRVPVALVVTHLENEDVMEDWWKRNEEIFDRNGVRSVAHACITALQTNTPLYAKKRIQSLDALQKLFQDSFSTPTPSYAVDLRHWIITFIEKLGSFLTKKTLTFLKKRDLTKKLEVCCAIPRGEALKLAEMIVKG